MSEEIKFKFLKDVPLGNGQDGVFGFYHSDVAPALKEILENESCVHTIGLFSKWGTGKSTIIEMIRHNLNSPMFVFDAWKYQEDSLRRIFLMELVNFLIDQKQLSQDDKKLLDPLYKSTEEHQDVLIDESHESEGWFKKFRKIINTHWVLSLTIFLAAVWIFFNTIFSSTNAFTQAVKDYLSFITSISLLALIFKPLFEKIWERSVDKFLSSLGPLASIKTRIEKEDRLNSPEQFEALFKLILKKVNKKVVIVFDNIDRVQGDAAIKILSSIKTFLDPSGIAGLVFIVPCDSEAIISQIKSFYGGQNDQNFDPSEYLRKLFNVVVWTPEFIEADLHAYIKNLINETGEIKQLLQGLDAEDIVYVISNAFSNNPREIKQFINNLVAALVLASKTEVWQRVKDNIAYMAKVLVLRQKFTPAYHRLKDKWFEPENIVEGENSVELRNFMLNTSRITVSNARPFIYFKEPAIYRSLNNSEEMVLSLAEGNKDKFKELTSAETNKGTLIDFIRHLLREYRSQKDILFKIFTTHLEVFHELGISPSTKVYYESLARVLDADLWQFFSQLPTNLIFSDLLIKTELDGQFRKPLIKRYVLAIGSEEIRRPDKALVLKDILTNLKQNLKFIESEDLGQVTKFIEEHLSSNFDVISIFETFEDQKTFISSQAFDKYIAALDRDSITGQIDTIKQYKEFISKKNKFGVILQKITELVNKETTENPTYRAEKETLFSSCGNIFSELQDQFKAVEDGIRIQLTKTFVQAFNSISPWDNRTGLVNNLRWVSLHAPEAQKNELVSLINSFFQNASPAKISIIFEYWKKESAEKFLASYFSVLSTRSMNDNTLLDIVYKKADKDKKIELLQNLVNQKGVHCLDFIKGLADSLPDRVAVIRSLLNKATALPLGDQIIIYDYLSDQFSKNDPTDLKDQIVEFIKGLLKSDISTSQESGLKLLSGSEFLGEEKKREIGKDVLSWLRQPGKVLNSTHRFSLKAVSSLVSILQETPIKDFVYTLFDMLKQDKDKQTLESAMELLAEIKPSYNDHEKDFKDLLARLKDWPENENKTLVIEKIQTLKSVHSKKDEKEFWTEITSLIPVMAKS